LKFVGPNPGQMFRLHYVKGFLGETGPFVEGEIVGLGKEKFLLDSGFGHAPGLKPQAPEQLFADPCFFQAPAPTILSGTEPF
jgi:hypothetical protein